MLSRFGPGSFIAGTAIGVVAATAATQMATLQGQKKNDPPHAAHHFDVDVVKGQMDSLKTKNPNPLAQKAAPPGYGGGLYVPRIALTGGPCGGKSSSMDKMRDAMIKLGYDVYFVPEVPTILINGGCAYPGEKGGKALDEFEDGLMALQLQIERSFVQIASSTGRPSVVIFDRGLMDIKAYLPPQLWRELLQRQNYNEDLLLDRYDAVVHLVTAANGAEKFYTLDQAGGEGARSETPEQARALDAKVLEAWSRHPHQIVVDNSSDFSTKLNKATTGVIAVLKELEKTKPAPPPGK